MKSFLIEGETDFCYGHPELSGESIVTATDIQTAIKIFNSYAHAKQTITSISERNK